VTQRRDLISLETGRSVKGQEGSCGSANRRKTKKRAVCQRGVLRG